MIIKNNNISKKITFTLFLIFYLVGIITYKDYGLTGDEIFERLEGFYWLNYVLSLTPFDGLNYSVATILGEIKGFSLPTAEDNEFYGVIFSLPAAFLEVIFQIEDSRNYYHFYHLLNFTLFFVASCNAPILFLFR